MYKYYINLDERGEFFADVRDENENNVFTISGFDIFEDGYMRHSKDVAGLREYLIELSIITKNDNLTPGNFHIYG